MARRTRAQINFDRYTTMRSRAIDIYRAAISFKSSHDDILERLRALYATREWQRLNVRYKDMIHSALEVWSGSLYEHHLEWRLGPASGPVRTAGDVWTKEMSEWSRTPGALFGAHFWRESDRPFSPWAAIN